MKRAIYQGKSWGKMFVPTNELQRFACFGTQRQRTRDKPLQRKSLAQALKKVFAIVGKMWEKWTF